ncbi:unnamed protein product [Moneuplotes crassus]|uniref:NAD-dependent epimerase/dehydratase domain-containing protein n=1 Tax=Euplotes crassus TaxID=5936 RepID=A0AAD1UGZ1_EUPCR|nr:unnamed protein product [Moneuplotes crassus]
MEDFSEKPLVLVTGASGYLGSWCVAKLLDTGKYRVRGTIRDTTNQDRMELLKKGFGDYFDQIEFVSADLQDKEAIKKAVEGVTYVLHVASPVIPEPPKDGDKEIIKPAIEGTRNVLKSSVGSGVKKVIITSSTATCQDLWEHPEKVSDHTTFVKEFEGMVPYFKSKIRAERYAFDFIDKFKSTERPFDVVVINPSFIIGKALLPRAEGASLKFVKDALENKMPGYPQIYLGHIDVQDCAQAHVNAIEKGENGDRFPLSSGTYKVIEFFNPIIEEYEAKGYKVSKSEINKAILWMVSLFNDDAAFYLTGWNIKNEVDGSLASEKLGIEYKPMKESILEACESLVNLGLVAKP